jgi:hypothetical protein
VAISVVTDDVNFPRTENSGTIRFRVVLSSASDSEVVVSFTTEDLTAISSGALADYTARSGTVTFAPGQTEAFVDIALVDDTRFEGNETFQLVVTDIQNAALEEGNDGKIVATIIENDTKPVVTIEQIETATEGSPVKFKVTLSTPLQEDITIPYSFVDVTAQGGTSGSGKDFVNTAGTITIPAGSTSVEFSVATLNDSISEPSETFTVELDAHELTAGPTATIGTIVDDGDPFPRLSIANMTIVEGNSGQKNAEFIVSLSAASGRDVTVTYQLFDRSATAGQDYGIPETLTITIPAGQTTGKILIPILGDTITEPTEDFLVKLTNATNAVIVGGDAIGTILDNERQFSLEFEGETETKNTITVNEPGNGSGNTTIRFRIVRSGDTSAEASVQYTTDNGVDREGVRGAVATGDRKDFAALSGTANFAAGASVSDWIELTINDDNVHEGLEEFFIRLQNGVNGSPSDEGGTGTVQIVDNDVAPTVTVSNPTVEEANLSGSTATRTDMVFKVTLSNPTELGAVTLRYATENGEAVIGGGGEIITAGAISGTSRADYEALSLTTLTFAPGETSKDVIVKVLGDVRDEYDETLHLNLTELNDKATFEDGVTSLKATGTITDNDLAPTITISDLSSGSGSTVNPANYNEADGFTTARFFRVSLSGESEKDITVYYFTADGTAVAGADFVGVSEGNAIELKFTGANGNTAGQTTKDISINVLEDSRVEDSETFEVRLKDATNASILDDRGQATILDNDRAIFTINDVTVVEGNDPNTPTVARFIVSLANAVDRTVTINYTTVDGTARLNGPFADYLFTSGTLTFDANTSTAVIEVPIISDNYKEAAETFSVRLSGGTDTQFAKAEGVATIQNGDDSLIGVAIEDVRIVEGAEGANSRAQFRVVTSGPLESGQTVTVKASTRDGLAVAGSDYAARTSTLTFTGSTVSQIFEVNVTGDNVFEAAENFFAELSEATITPDSGTVNIERSTGTAIIYNDDVQQIDARTVRWIDVDGDVVTLRISKGALSVSSPGDFDFINQLSGGVSLSTVGGLALRTLNLQNDGREFAGASITITAEPQAIFDPTGTVFLGDGKVDIGWINAGGFSADGANFFGIDLKNVSVDGGLAKLTVGDRTIGSPALRKLDVESLGVDASRVGIENTLSYFQGPVGKVKIAGDMEGQMQVVAAQFGRIQSIDIGGTLGGDGEQAGLILFSGKLGKATIGSVVGGDSANSGTLRGETTFGKAQIGKVTILGDVLGGAGEESGVINAPRIGKVTVLGDVVGGSGKQSGTIGGVAVDGGDLTTSSIKNIRVDGSLKGGTGAFSGSINALSINSVSVTEVGGGKLILGTPLVGGAAGTEFSVLGGGGADSGYITLGAVNQVILHGDVKGSSNNNTGGLNVVNRMSNLTLNGSLIGGDSVAAVGTTPGRAVNNSGFISAGQIGNALVIGDVISGHDAGPGLNGSGLIAAAQSNAVPGTIKKLEIRGDVIGNETEAVLIAALGMRNQQAISKLTIGGDVEFLDILAGLAKPGPDGLIPRNADAQLGDLLFEGNVRALNIAAGAAFGDDSRFGTADDEVLESASSQAPYLNEPADYSRIASVIIRGQVLAGPSGESGPLAFGIVAQEIGKVQIGNSQVALTPGESNDRTPNPVVTDTGLFVIELPRVNP